VYWPKQPNFHVNLEAAKARVNRKDWGLDWNVALEAGGWLVGDEVRLEVEVAIQERVAVAA
jgi:polyisoprenoid-binding protein YceI